ncbi:hypothetical protein [Vulgatibacter incomptus]|uniref:hypothetical protein n=1 Tax=Vulgatibacter incomptus TaxID=1391653 RepID=UPI000680005B|nr:hypothetical protein [Vulgatibacter incomptus]
MTSRIRWLGFAAIVATLSAGAIACGSNTEQIVLPLCEGVICDDPMVCDPTDGYCKCGGEGGIPCKPGESCTLDPAPQCYSPKCQFAECTRGESCDPLTGDCVCGQQACADGEVCVNQQCKANNLCLGVKCGTGLDCDPEDGDCKCGGVSCEAGEACSDGKCTLDPCAGVNCDKNSVCNPADGQCHCDTINGPICRGGEACAKNGNSTVFECISSDKCSSVSCVDGEYCDPVDGKCKCGVDGIECGPGDSCVNGECRGGTRCTSEKIQACRDSNGAGWECDPNDGVCKCGGIGGNVCVADAQTCTQVKTAPYACLMDCKPREVDETGANPSCAQGESCYIPFVRPIDAWPAYCFPTGTKGEGVACADSTECSANLFCAPAGGGGARKCRMVCDHDVDEWERCVGGPVGSECTSEIWKVGGKRFGYCAVPSA